MPQHEPIGKLTVTLVTEYYETPCGITDPHFQHRVGAAGGGGGSGGVTAIGPLRGEINRQSAIMCEFWCPGVKEV